jgi:hypothetical protein
MGRCCWRWRPGLMPRLCHGAQGSLLLHACACACACAPHSGSTPSPTPPSLTCSAGVPTAAAALQAAQLLGRHPLAPSERVLHYVGAVGSPASKFRSATPGWRQAGAAIILGLLNSTS